MMLVTYSYRAVCIFHFIGRTPDVKSVVGKTRRTNFKKNCSLSDSPHYEKIIFCLLYVSLSLWLSSFSTCTSFRFNFCIFFSSPTANCLVPFFRKIRFLWGSKKNFLYFRSCHVPTRFHTQFFTVDILVLHSYLFKRVFVILSVLYFIHAKWNFDRTTE